MENIYGFFWKMQIFSQKKPKNITETISNSYMEGGVGGDEGGGFGGALISKRGSLCLETGSWVP